jgi:hypothetical protein
MGKTVGLGLDNRRKDERGLTEPLEQLRKLARRKA